MAWLRRSALVLLAAGMMLSLGCSDDNAVVLPGPGGGGSGTDQNLQQGISGFSSALGTLASGGDLSPTSVEQTYQAFLSALQRAPLNPDANFGAAVFGVARAGLQAASELGVELDALRQQGLVGRQAALIVEVTSGFANPVDASTRALAEAPAAGATALLPLEPPLDGGTGGRATPSLQAIQAQLDPLLQVLDRASGLLGVAANSSSFAMVVSFTDGDGETVTLTFRQTEARLLKGVIDLLRGSTRLLLVYDLTANLGSPTLTPAELEDQVLTPAEYLPGGTFGQRDSDGAATAAEALANLRTSLDLLNLVWTTLTSSTPMQLAGQNVEELFDEPLSPTQQGQITAVLAALRALFTGTYSPDATLLGAMGVRPEKAQQIAGTLELNVPAFLTNPPSDLRSMLPTFGQIEGSYFAVGTWPRNGQTFGSWTDGSSVDFGGLITPLSETQANALFFIPVQTVAVGGDGAHRLVLLLGGVPSGVGD